MPALIDAAIFFSIFRHYFGYLIYYAMPRHDDYFFHGDADAAPRCRRYAADAAILRQIAPPCLPRYARHADARDYAAPLRQLLLRAFWCHFDGLPITTAAIRHAMLAFIFADCRFSLIFHYFIFSFSPLFRYFSAFFLPFRRHFAFAAIAAERSADFRFSFRWCYLFSYARSSIFIFAYSLMPRHYASAFFTPSLRRFSHWCHYYFHAFLRQLAFIASLAAFATLSALSPYWFHYATPLVDYDSRRFHFHYAWWLFDIIISISWYFRHYFTGWFHYARYAIAMLAIAMPDCWCIFADYHFIRRRRIR